MGSTPSTQTASSLGQRLGAILGAEHVRPAMAEDAISGRPASWVVEPGSEQEVAGLLRFADESQLAVIPRGGGTKMGWGNAVERADIVLSLRRLNRVIEHAWADLTVTVEAGCSFAELQRTLARHGQRLALDPLWPEQATLGGILSSNDTGALRLYYGGLRDLVIGITLALADGTLAKSGGKVVKNVAGYDLPKLVTGAHGTLGIVTRAVFRVHPHPANTRTLTLHGGDPAQVQTVLLALLNSNLTPASVQVRVDEQMAPVLDIGLEGTEAGLSSQELRIRNIAQPLSVNVEPASHWGARQELWADPAPAAIAKVSVISSSIAGTLARISRLAAAQNAGWRAVFQATGLGWVRIEADGDRSSALLGDLRSQVRAEGGALVILQQPAHPKQLDAWGEAGDALALMHAVKQQFDPNRTLNPGRYVGGI
ncbi:MAG TPA: FAD-binding oxidoreductase [Acidobacteriaceae bacterium]|nr:FAD-binding oxidoreductase [Acidobacteriaceae bacterium]